MSLKNKQSRYIHNKSFKKLQKIQETGFRFQKKTWVKSVMFASFVGAKSFVEIIFLLFLKQLTDFQLVLRQLHQNFTSIH